MYMYNVWEGECVYQKGEDVGVRKSLFWNSTMRTTLGLLYIKDKLYTSHAHAPSPLFSSPHTHSHTLPLPPVHQLHLDLWQVFVQSLHPQLVLVLQGLVQLMVPVQSPWTHVPRVESLLGRERGELLYQQQDDFGFVIFFRVLEE